MNFGEVAVSGKADGKVILAPTGKRTANGGVNLPSKNGTSTAASFTVSGEESYTYAITLPTNCVITSSGFDMIVDDFKSNPSVVEGGVLTLGRQTLLVGATLNVTKGQLIGEYINTVPFSVTVAYN